jgi:EAL domain-containing protein (putative c-di-GMP-specific phosphodiesterase class I)
LHADQLVLHYQPKVDLLGHVPSVEALVRWQHPRDGLLQPREFLPIAGEGALMRHVTDRVLDMALADCQAWSQDGINLTVAVNLFGPELLNPEFDVAVSALLTRWGIAPERLQVEVTENLFIADAGPASDMLAKLEGLGVGLSIDDFGTGHSGLSYLSGFRSTN